MELVLYEHKKYGVAYVEAICTMNLALTQGLSEVGVLPREINGFYSYSHQFLLPIGTKLKAELAFRRLEDVGINLNLIKIPFTDDYGFRIGVSEITRRGYTPEDGVVIGKIIGNIINEEGDIALMRQNVLELAEVNDKVFYC